MQEEEHILEDLAATDQKPRNGMYIAAAVSSTLQNAVSVAFFLYEYRMPGVYLSTVAGMVTLLTQLLFSRGLLLFGLVLFWSKRKSGWVISVVCYLAGICKMASTVQLLIERGAGLFDSNSLMWIGFIGVFMLSVLSFVLCLPGSVRRVFSVTSTQLAWTLVAGVLFLFATTFAEQMMNLY